MDRSSGLHSTVGFDNCCTFRSDDICGRSVEGQVLSIDMHEVPLDLVWKEVLIKMKQNKWNIRIHTVSITTTHIYVYLIEK